MQTNQQYQFVTWTRKGQLHYKMGVDCSNFTNELEDVQYSSQTYFGHIKCTLKRSSLGRPGVSYIHLIIS